MPFGWPHSDYNRVLDWASGRRSKVRVPSVHEPFVTNTIWETWPKWKSTRQYDGRPVNGRACAAQFRCVPSRHSITHDSMSEVCNFITVPQRSSCWAPKNMAASNSAITALVKLARYTISIRDAKSSSDGQTNRMLPQLSQHKPKANRRKRPSSFYRPQRATRSLRRYLATSCFHWGRVAGRVNP